MRRIENENVSIIRYVMSVGLISRSTYKRYATEAAHVEALSPLIGESIVETRWCVVDLIDADTARKKRVPPSAPHF